MQNYTLEICCYTAESAFLAELAGAHRIELCDNYLEGGTTPSFGTIKLTIEKLQIPVNVIVRPRGGDFFYSENEFKSIKEDIKQIKALNANGIVIGFLLPNGEIDTEKTAEVISMSGNMSVTFHRAFDMVKNPIKSLNQLIDLGVDRILTSGGHNSALAGATQIKDLIKKAHDKIIIMPGSGVNAENIEQLISKTKAKEFHSSAKKLVAGKMMYQNQKVSMSGSPTPNEFKHISVNPQEIKAMVKTLQRKTTTNT